MKKTTKKGAPKASKKGVKNLDVKPAKSGTVRGGVENLTTIGSATGGAGAGKIKGWIEHV